MGPGDARPAWLPNMEGSGIWQSAKNMETRRQFTFGSPKEDSFATPVKKIHINADQKSYLVQKEIQRFRYEHGILIYCV